LEYRSHLPWRIISARVDGADVTLSHVIKKDCDLVFCDIRDNEAGRTYQRGLFLLYLKAVHDLYGDSVHVEICNSVNRGIFTKIEDRGTVPDGDDLRQIEKRMW
jgi:uridine kinase